MKIYVLYDDPSDDGWNVHGLFSSEEKLNRAIEKFTPYSNYELYSTFFELDGLEKLFDTNKLRVYHGYSPIHYRLNEETIKSINWDVHAAGLDSFLEGESKKDTILLTNALWFSVYAESEEDAIRKGNEMLKELINQPEDERGWKWLEK